MSNLISKLFPKVQPFFIDSLINHAQVVEKASSKLLEILSHQKETPADHEFILNGVQTISHFEKECDKIVFDFREKVRLSHSWQLPFDADQLLSLMDAQDNIIDKIKSSSERIYLYSFKSIIKQDMIKVANLIHNSIEQIILINQDMGNMNKNHDNIFKMCNIVDKLETEADSIQREGLEKLFQVQTDHELIRYKEKEYDMLEEIMDLCEDVTKVVSNILVRNI